MSALNLDKIIELHIREKLDWQEVSAEMPENVQMVIFDQKSTIVNGRFMFGHRNKNHLMRSMHGQTVGKQPLMNSKSCIKIESAIKREMMFIPVDKLENEK